MNPRVCVVGTSFGARIHVPALRAAGFDVVALVGTDPTRTARRAERVGVAQPCASLADALALGLHAVSIATPPATHAPLVLEALEAGCHVLCEKPFTLDAAEAADLELARSAHGLTGLLGHEFRWSPAQAVVAWALKDGLVGTPRLAVSASFIAMLRTFEMPPWWSDPRQGGGWLLASGSHRVDALRQWFGDIAAVSAGLPSVRDPAPGVDDTFNIRCVTASGVEVALVQSGAAAGPAAAMHRVVGTAGTLWTKGDDVWVADDADPEGHRLVPRPELVLPDVEALATGSLADMTRGELPPYIRLAEAFCQAVQGGPPPAGPAPATFADGVAAMRVLDAIRHSAAAGGQWTEVLR